MYLTFKPIAGEEQLKIAAENCRKLSADIRKSNIIFGIQFLKIKDHPLKLTDKLLNQIMVVYRTGKFEVLPSGLNGERIKDYLGVQYARIVLWAALPLSGHKLHPVKNKLRGIRNEERDIYADW